MVATLRIAGGEDDIAFVTGWEKHGIVSPRVVSVVNDNEPRMTRVGKPCFRLLEIASVGSTKFRNIYEGLSCCYFVAGVDPENAPVTVSVISATDFNASIHHGGVLLLSVVICELQAHLTLSNTAITNYHEPLLRFIHLQGVGFGSKAMVQLFKIFLAASKKRVGIFWNHPVTIAWPMVNIWANQIK